MIHCDDCTVTGSHHDPREIVMGTTLEEIAEDIAKKIVPKQDLDAMGFDPITIAALISILMQLWPMIQDCLPEGDPPESIRALAAYRGPNWRWRQWRLRRVVAREFGGVASREMVAAVANEIMDLGENTDAVAAIIKGE